MWLWASRLSPGSSFRHETSLQHPLRAVTSLAPVTPRAGAEGQLTGAQRPVLDEESLPLSPLPVPTVGLEWQDPLSQAQRGH